MTSKIQLNKENYYFLRAKWRHFPQKKESPGEKKRVSTQIKSQIIKWEYLQFKLNIFDL